MGNTFLAASSSSSSSSLLPLLIIVAVVLLLYFSFTRRSRQRQAAQMNNLFVPGQQARTTSGMYGTIVSVEGDDVLLEVSPGVTVRMMKRAVVPTASAPSANGSGPGGATAADAAPAEDSAYDTGYDGHDEPSGSVSDEDAKEPQDRDAF